MVMLLKKDANMNIFAAGIPPEYFGKYLSTKGSTRIMVIDDDRNQHRGT